MDVRSAWMKQEKVHGGQAAASTQVEEEDALVAAAAGAEVSWVTIEVKKPAVEFNSWTCL